MKLTIVLDDISKMTATEIASELRAVAARIKENGETIHACQQTRAILSHGRGTTLHSIGEYRTELPRQEEKLPCIEFQMDDAGHHRLVSQSTGEKGDWTRYISVSTLVTKDGQWFIAASQYYDGVMPTEKACRLTDDGFVRVSGVRLLEGICPE
jgi:hypothetical protein